MKQINNIFCSGNKIRRGYFLTLILIATTFINQSSISRDPQGETDAVPINDGPYIFLEEEIIKARWMENSQLREEDISISN